MEKHQRWSTSKFKDITICCGSTEKWLVLGHSWSIFFGFVCKASCSQAQMKCWITRQWSKWTKYYTIWSKQQLEPKQVTVQLSLQNGIVRMAFDIWLCQTRICGMFVTCWWKSCQANIPSIGLVRISTSFLYSIQNCKRCCPKSPDQPATLEPCFLEELCLLEESVLLEITQKPLDDILSLKLWANNDFKGINGSTLPSTQPVMPANHSPNY